MDSMTRCRGYLETWLARKTVSSAVRRIGPTKLAIATDVGLVRKENQDRCLVLRTTNARGEKICIVALSDGMGGMESGFDCSVKTVAAFVTSCIFSKQLSLEKVVSDSALSANDYVYSLYSGRGGATLSAICFRGDKEVCGVNVGDSRIYSFSGKGLSQVSEDDTFEGRLGKDNEIFQGRNELIQYIGVGRGLEPNMHRLSDYEGDFLLSTDGVHFLDSSMMGSIVCNAPESAKAMQRLTELPRWCGGKDNATCAFAPAPENIKFFIDDAKEDYIELWDPYGELTIFSVEEEVGSRPLNENGSSRPKKIKRSSLRRRGDLANKKNKKSPSEMAAERLKENAYPSGGSAPSEVKKKPQLKIDFNTSKEDGDE